MLNFGKTLFFFAHPDDETLSAGGTINLLNQKKFKLKLLIASKGITSREKYSKVDIRKNVDDLIKASKKLGLNKNQVIVGDFEDNAMDSYKLLDVCRFLEKTVKDFKPNTIFTHNPFCTNQDHRVCYEASVIVTRPTSKKKINLICCETLSSSGYLKPNNFDPNLYISLKEQNIKNKILAMNECNFEKRKQPHPRSEEVIKSLSKFRGSICGSLFAEAFMVNSLYV